MAAKEMGTAEWAMLITLSVLWGGSYLFIGILVKVWPPLTIVAGRVFVAAPALWLFARLMRIEIPFTRPVGSPFSAWRYSTTSFPFA